mmetsp:Transcript_18577/g.35905  ORF Transcript_18577/g.35905 Transcript_18577/m.35905 type:complete len:200 (+) Transcript_18577:46-645(+)|eukprot:CAMPEP_0114289608 /NCGR_PEP_ID=MMETSP0059-20121206/7471_1 /TAXON_ID=36894 /ORGANISM="Pyramimonas parkeae, Strain CCMP726" /LENGTH=199 /DNA_ID=CAMNT_0001410905 /DNA_START=42 /DNA_END=641 /DNA_ORIENTATION=-
MCGTDPEYPGTALERLKAARERASSLSKSQLSEDWEQVRRHLLWAAGLKDNSRTAPGNGYTGHCFNDYIHCDATTMLGEVSHNENGGQVKGIQRGNQLGPGITQASLPELGPGGSWCTCMNGCHTEPPSDVAHVQFRSRIAWKMVWCAVTEYKSFVLVDDEGALLASGTPTGQLPDVRERRANYKLVQGSKYARAADNM